MKFSRHTTEISGLVRQTALKYNIRTVRTKISPILAMSVFSISPDCRRIRMETRGFQAGHHSMAHINGMEKLGKPIQSQPIAAGFMSIKFVKIVRADYGFSDSDKIRDLPTTMKQVRIACKEIGFPDGVSQKVY